MSVLPGRILCLVTDLDRAGGEAELLRIVKDAVRGGVNMVQVRAHELDDSSLTSLAAATVAAVKAIDRDAIVVVNGPPSVAAESGADGVHMREQSKTVRTELPGGLLAGRSAHSLAAACKAVPEGADYVILGTVFPSASHPGGATGGTRLVSSVTREISIPVIGIGGITAQNAAQVIAAGAAGVAVIGAIIGAHSPFDAARELATATGVRERR
ncbi:MAG: thiamine phosphate synthase [Chloroflexi bacterium]|nr:thiamine phosphate synthase [Chloroflexota bacterium]